VIQHTLFNQNLLRPGFHSAALGPRIIPVFRDIVDKCVSVISEGSGDQPGLPTIEENALTVLRGMLMSIPTFWGSDELMKVITLCTDHYSSKNSRPAASTSLLNTIAKRAPAKILLPTLCDMWSSIEVSSRVVTLSLQYQQTNSPLILLSESGLYHHVL